MVLTLLTKVLRFASRATGEFWFQLPANKVWKEQRERGKWKLKFETIYESRGGAYDIIYENKPRGLIGGRTVYSTGIFTNIENHRSYLQAHNKKVSYGCVFLSTVLFFQFLLNSHFQLPHVNLFSVVFLRAANEKSEMKNQTLHVVGPHTYSDLLER